MRTKTPLEQLPAAAATALSSDVLGLPQELVQRAARYRLAIDAVKRPSGDGAFCSVVEEAGALTRALVDVLAPKRDEIWNQPGGKERFVPAIDALVRELPGVLIENGAEVLYSSRYDAVLAPRAPTLAAEELLLGASPFLRAWPPYIRQVTDVQGCQIGRAHV